MNNHIYKPYTYLIGWSDHNKYYYGVRYAKDCHPSDLWSSYFTSSNRVKDFREEYGEPDIVQVRKTFDNKEKAIDWEYCVLRRMRVSKRNDFLNINSNPAVKFDVRISKKISEANKGRKHTAEHREHLRQIMTNRKHTWGDKISKALTGIPFTDSRKMKLKDAASKRDNTNLAKVNTKRVSGAKWYHDPKTGKSCQYKKDSQPEGWLPGRKPLSQCSPRKQREAHRELHRT